MKTLNEFKNKVQFKDVEGNCTYLHIKTDGFKYGQSYQNTVNTREGMLNDFIVFYYPLYQIDLLAREHPEHYEINYI